MSTIASPPSFLHIRRWFTDGKLIFLSYRSVDLGNLLMVY